MRISVFILLLLVAMGISESLAAQTAEEIYTSANADFAEKNYEQAKLKYLALAEGGKLSGDLFYNLGTSCYRTGASGQAMLWFRRAEIVEQGIPETRQNAEFLRVRLGFLEFVDSSFDETLRSLPARFGKWVGTIAAWLALISIAAVFFLPQVSERRGLLVTLSVLFAAISVAAFRTQAHYDAKLAYENYATVIADDAMARSAPTPGSSTVIELPEGSEVRLLEDTGLWKYIEIPGNLRGWIRSAEVEAIWPIPPSA